LKGLKDLDTDDLLELARYAFLRLDGAWFMASADKYGVKSATELNLKAWDVFSERLAKRIVSKLNLEGDFCQVLPKLLSVQNSLMNMKSEVKCCGEDRVVIRITDCEVWKMVSKVWTRETAPCYKVTQTGIRGTLRGAFPGVEFAVNHNKRIPLGDECCEVEIVRKKPSK
jgi:hypothetical protein